MTPFLHELPDFKDLIQVVAEQKGIEPSLVEKDYWIKFQRTSSLYCQEHLTLSDLIQRIHENLDVMQASGSPYPATTSKNTRLQLSPSFAGLIEPRDN